MGCLRNLGVLVMIILGAAGFGMIGNGLVVPGIAALLAALLVGILASAGTKPSDWHFST